LVGGGVTPLATSSYTYLDLPLEPGLDVGYGLTPFRVEAVQREDGKPTRVTLRMSGTSVDRLRAVRLLTADGGCESPGTMTKAVFASWLIEMIDHLFGT